MKRIDCDEPIASYIDLTALAKRLKRYLFCLSAEHLLPVPAVS
jgi:hypothetical protein